MTLSPLKIYAFTLLLLPGALYAQYEPLYSQYLLNGLAINPAYAGSRDVLSLAMLHREQWSGFDGAPKTSTLTGHMPLRKQSIAIGLLGYTESAGLYQNSGVFGNFVYRLRIGQNRLSLGLRAGASLLGENRGKLRTKTDADASFATTGENATLMNFGTGAYYNSKTWFIGFSLPTLLNYTNDAGGYKASFTPGSLNYLFTGGFKYKVSNILKLQPATMVRLRPGSPLVADYNFNLLVFKDELLTTGVSFRPGESVIAIIEAQVSPQIRIGYSYDYSVGPLKTYQNGSHEFVLRFELRYKVIATNPRYF